MKIRPEGHSWVLSPITTNTTTTKIMGKLSPAKHSTLKGYNAFSTRGPWKPMSHAIRLLLVKVKKKKTQENNNKN